MKACIGTSGFSYPAWKGKFYPHGLASTAMLTWYAGQFDGVEINSTFYHRPAELTLAQWAAETPPLFRFALKCPGVVTHHHKLVHAAEDLADFHRACGTLGDKLGPILYQLPPFLPKDLARLLEFLALLPAGRKAVFEFRHPSWLSHDVFRALRNHKAALCVADTEESPGNLEVTADFGYLRLRRDAYTLEQLETWARRVRTLPWKETFIFFKHEDEARGPQYARAMREIMGFVGSKGK